MKLIVGLWNPGKEYAKTRHSIGFTIVDDFVDREKLGKREYQNKWKWEMIESNIENLPNGQASQKIVFLKPMEFMNRSWWAVSMVANFYKIEPKDILVVHDDIDLPVGKIQLKLWWSSAGHNGLKDIIEKIWTKDFRRLRIGVDRPINQDQVADYVLHPFKKEEKNLIDDKTDDIEKYLLSFIQDLK